MARSELLSTMECLRSVFIFSARDFDLCHTFEASITYLSSPTQHFLLPYIVVLLGFIWPVVSCPSAFSSLSLMATKISLPSLWTEVQMAIQRLWGTTWELGEIRRRPWLVEIENQGLKGKGRAQRTVSVGVMKSGQYGGLQGQGWIGNLWCQTWSQG